jgi:hypothetical protein
MKLFCAWWVALFLYYWWLIGESKFQQFLAGALIAFGTAWVIDAVREKFQLQFELKPRWLLTLLRRIPGQVIKDLGILVRALWEGLRGTRHRGLVQTVQFDPGGTDAAGAARRALATAGISVAPNTYVISIDREKGLLIQHQLVPHGEADKERRL